MELDVRIKQDAALVEKALGEIFWKQPPRGQLYEAMEYSLMAGGKRLRPILTLEVCKAAGGDIEAALPLACAVEMVHTYSLIHDDLPAMDNDDLRRGKATNHKVYGEATAILAGDGLLTAAFGVIVAAPFLTEDQRLRAVYTLSNAAGPQGMVGGQVLDMDGETQTLSCDEIEKLQQLKTGALIDCAIQFGCIAASVDERMTQAARKYAQKLGLAFQVRDDILDVTATAQVLGKTVGSDEKSHKATFVTLLGIEACQRWVRQLSKEAQEALAPWPNNEFLCQLAARLAERDR